MSDMLQDFVDKSEWDWEKNKEIGLDYYKLKAKSNKKAWWLCSQGHSYEQSVAHKTSGNGCPYCSGRKVLAGYNDLQTTNPKLAAEWHPEKNGDLLPTDVTKMSNKNVWWLCAKCGHEWSAQIASRNKHGCPKCGAKKAGENHSISAAVSGKSIVESHPDIAATWDYALNPNDRSPHNVSQGSDKKYYWRCLKGHKSYLSSVASRVSGNGCPECAKTSRVENARKTHIKKRGSLAETNPDLAKQWNYEKNLEEHERNSAHPKTPDKCSNGSKRKVWWRCDKGHEYSAVVYSRVAGNGCPFCDSERKTSFPEQCVVYYLKKITEVKSQFKLENTLTLDAFLPDFNIGIEYDGKYWHKSADRDIRKNEVCASKGIRLIRILEPEHILDGSDSDCIRLKSTDDKAIESAIEQLVNLIADSFDIDTNIDINIDSDRISIMAGYISKEKEINLENEFPDLAKEWNVELNQSLQPNMFAPYSNKEVWWRCSVCGHEFQKRISSRTKGGKGCPVCDGKTIKKGYNDLATKNPVLAAEWHHTKNNELEPDEVAPNSHKKAWWLCPVCQHEWEAEIKSRNQGRGCPECAKLKRMKKSGI